MRTVWVTGASSGLGLAAAQAFAARGWLVIAGARSFEDETDMQAGEGRILRLKLDVTSPESCERFAARALALSRASGCAGVRRGHPGAGLLRKYLA